MNSRTTFCLVFVAAVAAVAGVFGLQTYLLQGKQKVLEQQRLEIDQLASRILRFRSQEAVADRICVLPEQPLYVPQFILLQRHHKCNEKTLQALHAFAKQVELWALLILVSVTIVAIAVAIVIADVALQYRRALAKAHQVNQGFACDDEENQKVSAAPEEEKVSAAPEEEVSAAPEEQEVSAAPEEVSAAPEEEVSAAPEEEVSAAPEEKEKVSAAPEEKEEKVSAAPEKVVPAAPRKNKKPSAPVEKEDSSPQKDSGAAVRVIDWVSELTYGKEQQSEDYIVSSIDLSCVIICQGYFTYRDLWWEKEQRLAKRERRLHSLAQQAKNQKVKPEKTLEITALDIRRILKSQKKKEKEEVKNQKLNQTRRRKNKQKHDGASLWG